MALRIGRAGALAVLLSAASASVAAPAPAGKRKPVAASESAVLRVGDAAIELNHVLARTGSHTVTYGGHWQKQAAAFRWIPAAHQPPAWTVADAWVAANTASGSAGAVAPHLQRYLARFADPSPTADAVFLATEHHHTLALAHWLAPSSAHAPSPRAWDRISRAYELVQALAALHKAGLVHGDLRPENVGIVAGRGTLLVTGTGLGPAALSGSPVAAGVSDVNAYLFRAPELLVPPAGTPLPVSPTVESDCFATGCLVFHIVTGGLHPFQGTDATNTLVNLVHGHSSAGLAVLWPGDVPTVPAVISETLGTWRAEAAHLCTAFLQPDPSVRVTPADAVDHVLFWPSDRRLGVVAEAAALAPESARAVELFAALQPRLTLPARAPPAGPTRRTAKGATVVGPTAQAGWPDRFGTNVLAVLPPSATGPATHNPQSVPDLLHTVVALAEVLKGKPRAELAAPFRAAWSAAFETESERRIQAQQAPVSWARWAAADAARPLDALFAYLGDRSRFPTMVVDLFLAQENEKAAEPKTGET